MYDSIDRLFRLFCLHVQGVQAAQVTVEDYGEGP